MEVVFRGKTKDVYRTTDGKYMLKFKDDVTGADGVFDPGANQVGLALEGAGEAALRLSKYFFELLHEKGIPTHYITADVTDKTMTVEPATPFGEGLEAQIEAAVIVNIRACVVSDRKSLGPAIAERRLQARGDGILEEAERIFLILDAWPNLGQAGD
mgnify:CR=1 FL=1